MEGRRVETRTWVLDYYRLNLDTGEIEHVIHQISEPVGLVEHLFHLVTDGDVRFPVAAARADEPGGQGDHRRIVRILDRCAPRHLGQTDGEG